MVILGAGSAGASVALICTYFDEVLTSRLSLNPATRGQWQWLTSKKATGGYLRQPESTR